MITLAVTWLCSFSAGTVNDGDEKRHCYVTITALPPLNPCEKCMQLSSQYSHADGGFFLFVKINNFFFVNCFLMNS